ncbi:MAG: hypothetical protein H0X07_03285 [Gemmatimonadales bacterium]|nr:hypothetical protein [Gemmatimonadales bacterium]
MAHSFRVLLKPGGEPITLEVHFHKSLAHSPKEFEIPDYNDREANFAFFAEAAVGEYLDANGINGFRSADGRPVVIECFPEQFELA